MDTWHRFKEKGIDGITSKKHNHKQHKFTNVLEKQIVDIASANPRSFGLGFATWSIRVMTGFLMYDIKLMDRISHSEIRNTLLKHKINYRKFKSRKRYDKNIQNIFVVLDNLSAHKSKMVKEEISKCCPRIKFVFLPVRYPELNLIEVRWSWLQRQTAINNSTFKNEQEIVQAVSRWKNIYNKNHGNKAITCILQDDVPLCLHSC
jgi:hypothetical protein